MKELEEYLEKILIYGLKIEPNDNLIIIINEDQPELYEIMENLRAKFHLRDIIYKVENLKDIYTTLSQNQKISLPEYRVPNNKNKVKVLQFLDDSFSDYMQKLYYESDRICDEYISYINAKKAKNKKFYDLLEKSRTLLSVYPSTNWANQIYGYNAQEKLLADIIKMVPENIREEIEKLQYIKDYLNSLKIKNLALYSDTETELEIGLNEYARWTVAEINFPSYEIYTSPDIRYAKGILCLEKPSILYGEVVTKAMLTFDKGKLTKVSSDNHDWEKMILNNWRNWFGIN